MRFYTKQHEFYCGIDLHAKKMYLCILDQAGEIRLHQNIKTDRGLFLNLIKPFRDDIVIAVECTRQRRTSVLMVLDRRSLQRPQYSLCPGSCPLHESHSRRQGQKR
jgi:hypothetical protein